MNDPAAGASSERLGEVGAASARGAAITRAVARTAKEQVDIRISHLRHRSDKESACMPIISSDMPKVDD